MTSMSVDGRMPADADRTAERMPFLSAHRIGKTYGPIRALDDVSVEFRPGEVHAIVGENGAGKSTLMKVLAGEQPADAGEITIEGRAVRLTSPVDAQASGIAIVHQHFELVGSLSVAENLYLGDLPHRGGRFLPIVDRRRLLREAREQLERFQIGSVAHRRADDIPIATRQIVEIVKAMRRDAHMLILDEPTSSLSATEIDRLFRHVRSLRDQGTAIVFIAHNIEEVLAIADRVSVLRDGRLIATQDAAGLDPASLVRMIVGRKLADGYPKPDIEPGDEVLVARNAAIARSRRKLSLAVRGGEIFGLPTYVGSPVDSVLEALSGQTTVRGGAISLYGRDVGRTGVRGRVREGICLVPGDATAKGLIPKMSIEENIVLPTVSRYSRLGFLDRRRIRGMVERMISLLDIRPRDPGTAVEKLSGGNRQKVVIAKWIASGAKVLLMDDPTKGVDVGAKFEIYSVMSDLATDGGVIVLASSDLDELIGLADRIAVFHDDDRTDVFDRRPFDKALLMTSITGAMPTAPTLKQVQ